MQKLLFPPLTLVHTNAFCPKGKEKSLTSSPKHLSSQARGATLGGAESSCARVGVPIWWGRGGGEKKGRMLSLETEAGGGERPLTRPTWDSAVLGESAGPEIQVRPDP